MGSGRCTAATVLLQAQAVSLKIMCFLRSALHFISLPCSSSLECSALLSCSGRAAFPAWLLCPAVASMHACEPRVQSLGLKRGREQLWEDWLGFGSCTTCKLTARLRTQVSWTADARCQYSYPPDNRFFSTGCSSWWSSGADEESAVGGSPLHSRRGQSEATQGAGFHGGRGG